MIRSILLLTAILIISSKATPIERNTLRFLGFPDEAENYETKQQSYGSFQKNFNDFRRFSRKPPVTMDEALGFNNGSYQNTEGTVKISPTKSDSKKPTIIDEFFSGKQSKRSMKLQELYEKFIELGMKYVEIMLIFEPHQPKEKAF
ncbi:uncharacterized protein LOC112051639 [Bicyclus anynana]|uniref:Uncharacterized protein LOC112051639 n=1 Tax=Bicyclus anynana TaxID=110368 RepID=A0A6J1NMG6_BICAN|nr:uncharacterized protein LOC112051639 [Bicyclus anynana]